MSNTSSHFFNYFARDPDPDELTPDDYRWEWRPISQNPFVERKPNKKQAPDAHTTNPEGPVIRNEAPKWVYLFYDLAWTSTFASLTQNGRFNAPWDTVSYLAFFILMWWIWAAQAMYTIHFYTNDWFHFASNLIQLGIFGTLAATTRGYNIANYIVHSPGTDTLESPPRLISNITDPKIYSDEIIAATSLEVIVISVTIILLIQYIRVIGYAYAVAPKDYHALRKLGIVPICMFMSISLFAATWMMSTSTVGRMPYGAKLKFVFYGAALIVEIVSHVVRERLEWRPRPARQSVRDNSVKGPTNEDYFSIRADKAPKAAGDSHHEISTVVQSTQSYTETPGVFDDKSPAPELSTALPALPSTEEPAHRMEGNTLPIPYTNTTLPERLEGVTTIILGEGINGIAGALWAVISAPGNKKSVITNAISAAIAVCFITYFYFEGPRSRRDPKGLRQMIWLLLHLPFLLGVILLLLGVKDQFLLTSFLSTVLTSLGFPQLIVQEGIDPINPSSGDSAVLEQYFIRRGIAWSDEWRNLTDKLRPIEGGVKNQTQNFEVIAWQWRLSLKICLKTLETFMGNAREISDDIQSKIDFYYANRTSPVLDQRVVDKYGPTHTMEYYKILTSLVEANIIGSRYILGLAGGVLISLSLLNLAHSKPRDRFQWGIILSRFVMGSCLVFLLLLNLGRYQTLWIYPEQKNHQAGVFRWITAYWALPTIALAHFIELVIETFITGLSKLRIRQVSRRNRAVKEVEETGRTRKEITSEMYAVAFVRPHLGELVWREVKKGAIQPIWGLISPILVGLKLKKSKP